MNALHYVASDCTHAQSQSGAREEEERLPTAIVKGTHCQERQHTTNSSTQHCLKGAADIGLKLNTELNTQ